MATNPAFARSEKLPLRPEGAYADVAISTSLPRPRTWYLPAVGIAAYLCTNTLYIFPQGSPQPGDVLLLLTVTLLPLIADVRIARQPLLYEALGFFVGWMVLVNIIWFCIVGDLIFVLKSLFYIYNAFIFLMTVAVGAYDPEKLRQCVLWACRLALPMEVVYLEVIHLGDKIRATGSFNNPNQLGYWAILTMACLGLAQCKRRLSIFDVSALGFGCYIIALSLSKAATVAGGLLIIIILIFCGLRRGATALMAVVLLVGLTYEIANGDFMTRLTNFTVIANLQHRLSGIGTQRDDSLLDRGYSRLFDNPRYLVLGAGEGQYERLNPDKTQPLNELNKEFHSTLGNILMSYGIIGLGLFTFMIFTIFRKAPWASCFYFVPIMIYGITHMGLRETVFWLFLAFVAVQSYFLPASDVSPAKEI